MRIFELVTEDEYDQFDRAKDPNFKKVDASQWAITDPKLGNWNKMDEKAQAMWADRAAKLQLKAERIYRKLMGIMPKQDLSALNGVKVLVPITGERRWGASRYDQRTITIDVGSFWDLADDCIAYVLGHEIGHMVWAWGPKQNWPKEKASGRTPSVAKQLQEELDADVYGALLAYQLGYDRRRAFDMFTIAYQREPYDPVHAPGYPSVEQRRKNIAKHIDRYQQEKDATQQNMNPMPELDITPPTSPSSEKAEKNAWLRHIMQGMQKFDVALKNNPDIQLA